MWLKVLFWLPPETPSKMVLSMSIFTSFFVLLLLLSKNVPSATDAIPLIGAYYCLNMVMIATSTICCTMVVHILFRGQGQVPWVLRKIFLEFLARIFCMIAPPVLPPLINSRKSDFKGNQKSTFITPINNVTGQPNGNVAQCAPGIATTNSNANSNLNGMPNYQVETNIILKVPEETCHLLGTSTHSTQHHHHHHHQGNVQQSFQTSQPRSISYNHSPTRPSNSNIPNSHGHHPNGELNNELYLSFSLIENDIKEIRDYLRHTRKKLESSDSKTKQTNDWKQVALVLDRGLFFLYIIAIIVSIAIMFNSYS